MHASVSEAWPAVARHHEGVWSWPYLDPIGEVTVGVGLLLEANNRPSEGCFGLPWTVDGIPATRVQVAAGWDAVKARNDLAGRAARFEVVSRLRLDDRTINSSLLAKTREFWSVLRSQLVDLDEWPADAQLGLIDMAYQLGPRFLGAGWPNFTAAAHSSDFQKCSQHCSVKQASEERNGHRIRLFQNAAQVEFLDIDPGVLWDERIPEGDDMLTDAQITQIAEKVADLVTPEVTAAVVAQLKTPPTPAQIAAAIKPLSKEYIASAVWTDDAADRIPSPDNLTKWLPGSYLQRIYLAIKAKQ